MARFVLLDAGPIGLACSRRGVPLADRCRAWVSTLRASGTQVVIPAVAEYEVRRELIRVGASAKLRNLAYLRSQLLYLPVTGDAWRRAAEFWALVRRGGLPTAPDEPLDADAILAAMAATLGQSGDVVTIATGNVGHLRRFPGVDAQPWAVIV